MLRYLQWVLRHRAAVLVVVAAVTAVALWMISQSVIASSPIKLFFGENPKFTEYRELAERFSGTDLVVVGFDDPDLLTPDGFTRLSDIVEELRSLPFILRVESIESTSRISSADGDLIVQPYQDLIQTASAAQVAKVIVDDPLASGLMVSADGKSGVVLIELDSDPDRPMEAIPEMIAQMKAPFQRVGINELHLTGLIPDTLAATEAAKFTVQQLFPVTVFALCFVVFMLFGRIWPVLITSGVALIAIIWTFGLAVTIDRNINLLMAMVPAVMTVIAFSDIIHMYSAFARAVQRGLSQHEAVLESGCEVGVACLYTSATTFAGFASLAFIPTPVLRQLGIVLGAGVAIALLLALTLVPIALGSLPGLSAGARAESRWAAPWVDSVVAFAERVSSRHAIVVNIFFVGVCIASAIGMSRIQVEASFTGRLSEGHPARISQAFLRDRFSGANFVDIYVLAPEGQDVLDHGVLKSIADVSNQVETWPEVDDLGSLSKVLNRVHNVMGAQGSLPTDRSTLAQYLLLFEVAGGEGLEVLVDDDRSILRLSIRTSMDGLRGLAGVGDRVAVQLREKLPGDFRVLPTGVAYLFGDWIDFILQGQRRGLTFAILSTAFMMIMCLRSFRVGLFSMLPNLLPLAVLGGYVGFAWDTVDSDTMVVAVFAIGMAVDDTIHFLTRVRHEVHAGGPDELVMRRTFDKTGRAIVQTTVILCIGFSPFAFADYFTTRILGTLLPMTLFVALIADLFWVPALVKLGVIRFKGQNSGDHAA